MCNIYTLYIYMYICVCVCVELIKMSIEICLYYRFMTFNIKVITTKLPLETNSYIFVLNSSRQEVFLYVD